MKLDINNKILINLILLQQAFGAGSYKAIELYSYLSKNKLLDKDITKVAMPDFISDNDKNRISAVKIEKIYKIINDCIENQISILTILDPEFPDRLRYISEPPLVLYIKGDFPDIDSEPAICIVGPRKISDFGKKAAFSLAKRLAKSNMIIVSGGAMGADTFAHKGALSCSGRTICVWACGICYRYLPQNKRMRDEISESCCIISEHPPYSPTTKYCFTIRNRLMSALSLGTVVIEAGLGSGALNTAKHAVEQGRDVFVIPGNPTYECYMGSNNLLRDGALPLIDASDIFNQYIFDYAEKIDVAKAFKKEKTEKTSLKFKKKLTLGLSNEARIVYNNLDKHKFTVDDLNSIGLTDDKLISAITELEMENLIKALPGGMYETTV